MFSRYDEIKKKLKTSLSVKSVLDSTGWRFSEKNKNTMDEGGASLVQKTFLLVLMDLCVISQSGTSEIYVNEDQQCIYFNVNWFNTNEAALTSLAT